MINKKISVCIPTFKAVKCLETCLSSAVNGQDGENEIIVFIDGTFDVVKDVVEKFKSYKFIRFINSERNVDMCEALNRCVSFARNNILVIVNDDHVFPKHWDTKALAHYEFNTLVSFGAIESKRSTFKYTAFKDFGNQENFDMEGFLEYDPGIKFDESDYGVCQLPFMINKFKYLGLGGFDPGYIHAERADCDFFLKAQIMNMKFKFADDLWFYHFGSQSMNNKALRESGLMDRSQSCAYGFKFSEFKWSRPLICDLGIRYLFSRDINVEMEMMK